MSEPTDRDSGYFAEEQRNAETDHQPTRRDCEDAEESESNKKKIGPHMCPFYAAHRHKEVRLQVTPIERKYWLETPLTEEQLLSISEEIGLSWHDLGHKLGVPLTRLQSINIDHSLVKNKAITVLMLWRQQNGKKATVVRLAHALIAAGRRDVAEKLAGGDQWLLQLTVDGVLKTREEVSTKGCYYVCTDACEGKTYLVSEIDKASVVIDNGDMLTAKVTGLWNELRGLESPFTIDCQSDVTTQLMHCENVNRRLQGLDTQLLNLTGEAGQTNLDKPETIQSLMVLKDCTLMLHTQNTDLANRIGLLRLQCERMEEAQRRQLEILQTSQEGIPKKITRIDGILDVLMQKSVGSRNSAPTLSAEIEHVWPEKIVKFLSDTLSRFDTKL